MDTERNSQAISSQADTPASSDEGGSSSDDEQSKELLNGFVVDDESEEDEMPPQIAHRGVDMQMERELEEFHNQMAKRRDLKRGSAKQQPVQPRKKRKESVLPPQKGSRINAAGAPGGGGGDDDDDDDDDNDNDNASDRGGKGSDDGIEPDIKRPIFDPWNEDKDNDNNNNTSSDEEDNDEPGRIDSNKISKNCMVVDQSEYKMLTREYGPPFVFVSEAEGTSPGPQTYTILAAIAGLRCFVPKGDHIVAVNDVYSAEFHPPPSKVTPHRCNNCARVHVCIDCLDQQQCQCVSH